ncbi:hypothetical protein Z965_00275 [Clostridium novyi A str. BKT29909]|uniref:SF0329 family protein n=1 Tax=Clostridium novyi TaxID=1542 RepID=UPI0004D6FBEB|nr:hypothetical protein [Clostridium novyi]KEH91325.1 hypothetical protein Z965_00275 [Clostridium novyi A str. BKT29909]
MGQSWSGIKKRLEKDLLCNSLKGRVKYFITKYKNSHDESGRVVIIVDGKEIIQGNIFRYFKGYWKIEQRYKKELNIPRRVWNGKEYENDFENKQIEEYVEDIRLQEEIFDVWQFTDSVEKFLSMSIEESLASSNPLIRLLAIMDRRVGKRTLKSMKSTTLSQPKWIQYFYNLRFKSEGLI